MKISDEQLDEELKTALSLFRESVHELHPEGATEPIRLFAAWRIALVALAMLALLISVPLYRHQQQRREADLANIAKQDDAFLRHVESDVSVSVPPPMQRLEILMASDSTANSERTK
jgi:hypothetical protein